MIKIRYVNAETAEPIDLAYSDIVPNIGDGVLFTNLDKTTNGYAVIFRTFGHFDGTIQEVIIGLAYAQTYKNA